MRFIRILAAASLLAISIIQAQAAGKKGIPAAILLSCSGEVTVQRASGEETNGTFGLPLYAGDEVRTAESSGAEIHFEGGMWLQVGSNSSMIIKDATAKSRPPGVEVGEESFEVVQNMMRLKDPKGTSSLAALRSSPGKTEIGLLSPCQTTIIDPRPVFAWKTEGIDEELKLTVYDEEGICYTDRIKEGSRFEYPAGAPDLKPGVSYSWTLETTDPLRVPPVRSRAAFFEVLSRDDSKKLESSLGKIDPTEIHNKSTYHFLRASVYFNYGLLENAIREMKMAVESGSDSKEMHSILARLYAETGRTEEAISEYDALFEK